MPPVRMYPSELERDAARSLDAGDQLSRIRKACRALLILAIVEAGAIAGLLAFVLRASSSC